MNFFLNLYVYLLLGESITVNDIFVGSGDKVLGLIRNSSRSLGKAAVLVFSLVTCLEGHPL